MPVCTNCGNWRTFSSDRREFVIEVFDRDGHFEDVVYEDEAMMTLTCTECDSTAVELFATYDDWITTHPDAKLEEF